MTQTMLHIDDQFNDNQLILLLFYNESDFVLVCN